MKTLIIVHCHKEAEPVVKRHYDLWQKHGHQVIITSPEDSQVRTDDNRFFIIGKAAHCGPTSIARFKQVWERALESEADRYVFMEYDSFITTVEIPWWNDCLIGNRFEERDHSRFKSPVYYHAPWVMPRHILKEIVDHFDDVPACEGNNYFDRYLGLLLTTHGIPNAGWGSLGFARNTVLPEHYDDLRHALATRNPVAFHGIKSAEALDIVLRKSQ